VLRIPLPAASFVNCGHLVADRVLGLVEIFRDLVRERRGRGFIWLDQRHRRLDRRAQNLFGQLGRACQDIAERLLPEREHAEFIEGVRDGRRIIRNGHALPYGGPGTTRQPRPANVHRVDGLSETHVREP
jgi:hypothetical protein